MRCSSGTLCSNCAPGYSLSGNACTKVCTITNCATCDSTTTCGLCAQGYSLNALKKTCTLQCSVLNCATCSSATVCGTCNTGFSLVNTYCVPQCQTGSLNTGNTTNPTCEVCSASIALCETCSSKTNCTTCTTGSYLATDAASCPLCSLAIANCQACSSAINCLSCSANFYLASRTSCMAKGCTVANCLHCYAATPVLCAICAPGFQNQGGVCVFSCPATFIYDLTTGDCGCGYASYAKDGKCASCDNNCHSCDIVSCKTCDAGYFPEGPSCTACGTDCLTCLTASFCTLCNHGYYNKQGLCAAASLQV